MKQLICVNFTDNDALRHGKPPAEDDSADVVAALLIDYVPIGRTNIVRRIDLIDLYVPAADSCCECGRRGGYAHL